MKATNVTGKSAECLNLNIIRPSQKVPQTKKLPVAVWLYGGAFGDGFGADLNSNYSWFVQESVAQNMPLIAITLNYRVGFLGFLGGEAAAAAGITNLGLKDQRQALRWIRENIAAFGGDPNRVTLWGQSAGAQSIACQLIAYGGKTKEKLFHQAIMVSSCVGMGNTVRPASNASVEGYNHILNTTNCLGAKDTIDCLRKVPLDALWKVASSIRTLATWWPTIDGDFVPKPPTESLLAGSFPRDVSILAGTNSDEGFAYSSLLNPGFDTEEELYALLRARFVTARNESLRVGKGNSHEALQKAMTTRLISYINTGDPNSIKVKVVPTWLAYTVKKPTNIVFNATDTQINLHLESDTWREEGMAIWAKYPAEFDLAGSLKPGL